MWVFAVVAGMFVLGALTWLLPALWRPPAGSAEVGGDAAAALVRDLQREAERDAADGRLPPDRLGEAQAELVRRAQDEGSSTAAPSSSGGAAARRTAIVLAVLLPLASALIYLQLGDPRSIAPEVTAGKAAGTERHATTPEQIEQRAAVLAERLRARPDDADGWAMLARSYTMLGRYRDAAGAFERAAALVPNNANLLADWADVLGAAQGKRLAGKPAQIIQRALDADPRHVKALALAGSVSFETRDYAAARGYWQRVLEIVPPDSPLARSAQGNIAQATVAENAATKAAPPTRVAGAEAISGRVEISPELAARVAAGDTLFVFARAVEGPRVPLAIWRQQGAAWPSAFRLDDSMAMSPELRLSAFQQVVLGARLSRSGNATPQAGDLIGHSAPLSPGARDVRLVIDRVQP